MPTSVVLPVLRVAELAPALAEHFAGRRVTWAGGRPPAAAGVYVWSATDDAVVYVGSARSLASRIAEERGWIGAYDPNSSWEVSVVQMLSQLQAEVRWVATEDHPDALVLERRLIEWHRACVGSAPLVVGWEAKPGSARQAGQRWAQDLWRVMYGTDGQYGEPALDVVVGSAGAGRDEPT